MVSEMTKEHKVKLTLDGLTGVDMLNKDVD